jgi:beta-lactamase class A
MLGRRLFLAGGAALAAGCGGVAGRRGGSAPDAGDRHAAFEMIRATLGPGARLGVAAIDTGSDRELLFDADSRYAMASTFKLPLAAAILSLVDRGAASMEEELAFGPGDPLDNSPTVAANVARGRLPLVQLTAGIIERSDNSAANILLGRLGGPEALTRFIRACGDAVTRLDRYEMELNSNLPGDPRDTTSPAAMARLTRSILTGDILSEQSRTHVSTWLKKSVPGPDRLPAGFPDDWLVGHKTGTGANGAVNDVAVGWRSGRAPVVVSCYQSGGTARLAVRAAAHAAVARLVAAEFS